MGNISQVQFQHEYDKVVVIFLVHGFHDVAKTFFIDGLLPIVQYLRKFCCKQSVLNTVGYPILLTWGECGMRLSTQGKNV